MEPGKVLIVSLGTSATAVADHLQAAGWRTLAVTDLSSARRVLAQQPVKVGLLLLNSVSPEGFGWVEECMQLSRRIEWVGVFDTAALAAPLLRDLVLSYFFDHQTQPLDLHELDLTLTHALRRSELRDGSDKPRDHAGAMDMVGRSPAIVRLQQQIRKVASTDAPVLIGGESGSGKELSALAIHQCSRRAAGPFLAVNCGAIAPSLIHSELFGHERGAFTGATTARRGLIEEASSGTIFLDEIADLPLELQTNLLRFLQEHTIHRVGSTHSVKVDVRVVAASHVDLAQAVVAGRFRDDLFYRLNVLPITVPPLRERMSDVPVLSQFFLERCLAEQPQRRVEGFSQQAVAAMMAHTWPGNVRELCNRVQRAVVMTDHRQITAADLGLAMPISPSAAALDTVRTMAERDAIALTLGRVNRNVTHAARELGISRMTLYRLMDKHGLAAR
ncbi:MAG: sigma-54-dependent Fis family transcriptional regulator [Burkholderiales bacterium]|nr:sigma-54-dependent Fis family transcriptional regulator [Burkholderiales bacterium]